ncbi:insulinase family protein [Shewanella sp. 202IG2-18]|uniref:insulinase family protein n=1 Tax=Parashewanella hymeniacidonis TaxID=2807618 RepID=UPI00195F5E1C|nr:insulinase family protein [Parashewanella hymeniacidonis]MBM7073024.1 insulinase family protein [Parashewanella hymeniacidonis]
MNSESSIITSPNDHRQYRSLTLENDLKIVLIEDKNASKSAVSLTVNVGHFDDPKARPGMAHFLEHMLFLGTEKYPDSGSFHAFVNQHGGNNNAWTGTEHTSFFSTIIPSAFDDLLDRFSQFFIAPLFDAELVERERNAIDSEYSLKLKEDLRRIYEVSKETSNQDHPFSKFSVGNLQTLAGEPENLRQELVSFYEDLYSANLMTLCIVSSETLATQEKLAHKYFSNIKNKQLEKQYPDVAVYGEDQQQKLIKIIPLKKQKHLTISFTLPNIEQYYRTKPLTFISHLLGNENSGSLLSYLKEKSWANHLSSGGGISGYNFKEFAIHYQLTDLGIENIDEIVRVTLEYIQLITAEGLKSWRYEERANLLKQAFEYQEPTKSGDLASHVSLNLQHYDFEDVLFGDYRMDELVEEEALELVSQLKVNKMRLTLIALDQPINQTSHWYSTNYAVDDFTIAQLVKWRDIQPRTEIHLPEVNPYILEDVIPRFTDYATEIPEVISESKGFRLWHLKDQEFQVPKGHMYFAIDSLHGSSSARHAMLTRLYIEMLLDNLTEHTYAAEVAGLGYHIYPHQAGLTLHVSGFTPKQYKLLMVIIEKARERNFSETRFKYIKRQLGRSWGNISKTRPISQLFSALTATMQLHSFEPLTFAHELETATLDELHQHVDDFYKATYVEGLIYGDFLKKEAEQISQRITKLLTLVSAPSDESTRELVNITNRGTLVRELEIEHQDNAILIYYQSKQTNTHKMAMFSLLNQAISSAYFHELRTQQQLGYVVGTNYLPLNRHPGIIFYIQSPTVTPDQLLTKIDQFLADYAKTLLNESEKDWSETKQGLINSIMQHEPNLKTRSQRLWSSIGNKDYDFTQREKVVEELKQITQQDMQQFISNKLTEVNCDRVVLTSCSSGNTMNTDINGQKIDLNIDKFKETSKRFKL